MRLLFSSLCLLLWGCLWSAVYAKSAVGDRILVVMEDEGQRGGYTQLWKDLETRDFKVTFESPKNEDLSLFRHGELAYEHLILAPPKSKGYGPSLTPRFLLDFINAGGNILLGLSSASGTPSAISSLLLELDIALPGDRSAVVVDHFNYDTSSATEKHDILLLPRPSPLRPDVVNFFGGAGILALPNTVGQSLGNASPLLTPILKASKTAFSYNPSEEDPESSDDGFATGTQLSLVSAMQARNSARFAVLGSFEMLSDKWFTAKVKGIDGRSVSTVNREFSQQLTEWAFKEVGVLRVDNVEHHLVEEGDASKPPTNTTQLGFLNPEIYRVKNDVHFSATISQWAKTHWAPYTPPSTDAIQLEFSMLSPFHRLPLSATATNPNSTTFATTFTTPDQHGIFAFKLNYKRPFLTNLEEKRQVTVRHFAHDEYVRSFRIQGAVPWVTGLWGIVVGWVLFVAVWLYAEPREVRRDKSMVSQ